VKNSLKFSATLALSKHKELLIFKPIFEHEDPFLEGTPKLLTAFHNFLESVLCSSILF
jgi:hypothetical protein